MTQSENNPAKALIELCFDGSLVKGLQADRERRRAEKERESIDSLYTSTQIRDAAYEVLSRLTESEYESAERILWALREQLERASE
jgi:hypothetical protein